MAQAGPTCSTTPDKTKKRIESQHFRSIPELGLTAPSGSSPLCPPSLCPFPTSSRLKRGKKCEKKTQEGYLKERQARHRNKPRVRETQSSNRPHEPQIVNSSIVSSCPADKIREQRSPMQVRMIRMARTKHAQRDSRFSENSRKGIKCRR